MKEEIYLIEFQQPQSLSFIASYFSKENRLSTLLNDKRHRLAENEASYRLINYWQNEGLLTADRSTGSSWRKYSLIDLVWVRLLIELRKFGYPIEGLKKLKANLTAKHPLHGEEALINLEAYLAIAIVLEIPVFLNVLPDGISILATQREKQKLEEGKVLLVNSHINISINHILSLVTKKDFYPKRLEEQLTLEEAELLTILRTSDISTAEIRFKNGKIDLVQITNVIDSTERIDKILRSGNYQDITIKQKDGKVVHVVRKVTKKLGNKAK